MFHVKNCKCKAFGEKIVVANDINNIEYKNIKFENGKIEKQSGEQNKKVGNFSVNKMWLNLT